MEVKKIKNILTAIGNPLLNNELKKTENINIINNDIQYQDGIFEILEINKKIDFLILSQLIPGKLKIEELLEKIQENIPKIKIIIILEKYDEKLEKILIEKNIYRILYNNKIEIKDIIKIINEDEKMEKYNEEIRKEIEELKKYIVENNKKNNIKNNKILEKISNKINKKFKKDLIENKIRIKNKINKNNIKFIENQENIFKINNKKEEKNKSKILLKKYKFMDKVANSKILNNKLLNILFIEKINKYNIIKNIIFNSNCNKKNNKIISIVGNNGSGKSIFSVLLAKELKKYSEKILIIDFDILNNSLHTILGVKKYPEKIKENINNKEYIKEINIENLIIKINKKIDLVSGINLIFDCKNKISLEKLKELVKKLSLYYDAIIIDTSSECFFDYTKEILKISEKCIYLTEANLLEISKSKRILEIYQNNWNIGTEKIDIIFNKYNKNSLNMNLLKKLYSGYKILGKIDLNTNYNLLINKNIKYLNLKNKEKNKIKYLKVS